MAKNKKERLVYLNEDSGAIFGSLSEMVEESEPGDQIAIFKYVTTKILKGVLE